MFTCVRAAIGSSALRVAAVVPGRRIDESATAGAVEALQLGEALLGVVEDVVRVLFRTPARRPGEDVLVDVREAELLGRDRAAQRLDHGGRSIKPLGSPLCSSGSRAAASSGASTRSGGSRSSGSTGSSPASTSCFTGPSGTRCRCARRWRARRSESRSGRRRRSRRCGIRPCSPRSSPEWIGSRAGG